MEFRKCGLIQSQRERSNLHNDIPLLQIATPSQVSLQVRIEPLLSRHGSGVVSPLLRVGHAVPGAHAGEAEVTAGADVQVVHVLVALATEVQTLHGVDWQLVIETWRNNNI